MNTSQSSQYPAQPLIDPVIFMRAEDSVQLPSLHQDDESLITPVTFYKEISPEEVPKNPAAPPRQEVIAPSPLCAPLDQSDGTHPLDGYPFQRVRSPLQQAITAQGSSNDAAAVVLARQRECAPSVRKESNPYAIAQELLEKACFAMVKDALYVFNGIVYEQLSRVRLYRLIVDLCRADVASDGSPALVRAVADYISMEPNIEKNPSDSPHYLAFRNGILDIGTGSFIESNPKYFFTSYLNVDYRSGTGECTHFNQFVSQIAQGHPGLEARIWEMIGYLLTTDMNAKAFVLLVGPSDTGKSLLGRFLLSCFNSQACASVDINRLGDKFSLSELVGKRINASLDLPSDTMSTRAVSIVKQLTGGDDLTAEVKYENPFRFTNTCKLVFATNHTLRLREADEAFSQRVLAIPFTAQIPKEQQNPNMMQRFGSERLGVVIKALSYYQQLVRNRYVFSGGGIPVVTAEPTVLTSHSILTEFVETCCEFASPDCGTFSFLLFGAFDEFCLQRGYPGLTDRTQFSILLQEVCGDRIQRAKWRDKTMSSNPENGYRGIVLRPTFRE